MSSRIPPREKPAGTVEKAKESKLSTKSPGGIMTRDPPKFNKDFGCTAF